MKAKEKIARRAALELHDGEYVNLGFGIPTAVSNYTPEGVNVFLQAENGCLHFGPAPQKGFEDADIGNAGGQPITFVPGSAAFDLATSFMMIRGGYMDGTYLGALEVDQEGNIANWALPLGNDRYSPGPGGAMDLVSGAKHVVALLTHTNNKGVSKIKKKCTLPLTGVHCVDMIITDLAVFEVTETGLLLKEIAPEIELDKLKELTEAEFEVAKDLQEYRIQ